MYVHEARPATCYFGSQRIGFLDLLYYCCTVHLICTRTALGLLVHEFHKITAQFVDFEVFLLFSSHKCVP